MNRRGLTVRCWVRGATGRDGHEHPRVGQQEEDSRAKFSMTATIPIAKNSLTSDVTGPVSGGGGLADSYYQPFILGWNESRYAIRAVYGFLAPTGRFRNGANDNVGSGYWTHAFSSGQTFYLTKNKATSISVFQMYEVHTTQKSTSIHPGDTLDLDYSVMHSFSFGREARAARAGGIQREANY